MLPTKCKNKLTWQVTAFYWTMKETCLFTVLSTDEQPGLELMYTWWEVLSVQLLVNIQRTQLCWQPINDKQHQKAVYHSDSSDNTSRYSTWEVSVHVKTRKRVKFWYTHSGENSYCRLCVAPPQCGLAAPCQYAIFVIIQKITVKTLSKKLPP